MLRMMCKNCGCDTFPFKNEKICSCEIVHFKKLENRFLKLKIFIADFTLYMSFLRHMVHTDERAYQDLQKRFFHLKVILQYDFYQECMSFMVKTLMGFFGPLLVHFEPLYIDFHIGHLEKPPNLYFHKSIFLGSSAAYFKIPFISLYI